MAILANLSIETRIVAYVITFFLIFVFSDVFFSKYKSEMRGILSICSLILLEPTGLLVGLYLLWTSGLFLLVRFSKKLIFFKISSVLLILLVLIVYKGLDASTSFVWIGISYISFKALHFSLSLSSLQARPSIFDLLFYLLFPPTLFMGPIHSFDSFFEELNKNGKVFSFFREICYPRIIYGLVKITMAKFFFYNSIAQPNSSFEFYFLYLASISYCLYVYLFFSGIMDLVIELAKLYGVSLPENFNFPLLSGNIQIFWNRWHITLSHFFRDFFYYPILLIMRRRFFSVSFWILNSFSIILTFMLLGLWHGLSINWLVYGAYHGLGLSIHGLYSKFSSKIFGVVQDNFVYRLISVVLTFHFVVFGFVISYDFDLAIKILAGLF